MPSRSRTNFRFTLTTEASGQQFQLIASRSTFLGYEVTVGAAESIGSRPVFAAGHRKRIQQATNFLQVVQHIIEVVTQTP